jgi:hypothetical protein
VKTHAPFALAPRRYCAAWLAVFLSVLLLCIGVGADTASAVILPFSENFSCATGNAPANFPAETVPANRVLLSENSTTANRVLQITAGDPFAGVNHPLTSLPNFGPVAWLDIQAQSPVTAGQGGFFLDFDGMKISFVRESATSARFYAYDGKQGLANNSDIWKPLGSPISANSTSFLLAAFTHLTLEAWGVRWAGFYTWKE